MVRTFGLEADAGARVVPAMAFTPYVALTAAVPLIVALALRRWAVAGVAVLVGALLAAAVLPRAFAGPRPRVVDGVPVTLMTSNIYMGSGDARTIVGLVRRHDVDVLAVEELTADAVRRLDAAGLRRLLPHRDVDARDGASGTGLFSRLPLRSLKPYNSLNLNGEPRALVTVPGGGAPLDVQAVHPPPPIHGRTPVWTHMLGELPLPDRDAPARRVLIGDFNATLDHARLRRLLGDGGYVDAADATGEGLRTTWPAGRHFPPELTIDHVLLDPSIRARDVTVSLVPRSDHRAVIADVLVPRFGF